MPIIHKIPQPHHLVKLKGDSFCGFYKSSLIGDADFEYLKRTAEFAGDWAWRLKRIVGTDKRPSKRRYKLKFHLFEITGEAIEPIHREINGAITLEDMCLEIDRMTKLIIDEQDNQGKLFDFYKSYVVVRA